MTTGRWKGRSWRLRAVAFGVGGALVAAFGLYQTYDRYHESCTRAMRGVTQDDEIVMVAGEDLNPGRRRQELIRLWNQSNPDTPARLIEIPGGADQEYSQLLASLQLGCGYDVLSLDVVWIPVFIRAGYLERFPTGAFRQETFLAKPWRTGTGDDGAQYAIPFHSDVGLLYYREDIVPEPPRTWAELGRATTGAALGRLTGPDPKAGLATQLADYEGLTVNGMEAIWGAGGTLAPAGRRIGIDTTAARALQRLTDAVRSSPPLILNESTAFREADSIEAFRKGRVLFLRNWPYAYPVLASDPSLATGPSGPRFGVAELPGPDTGSAGAGALGGQGLAIPKNARHKEQARRLIAFLTEEEQQQKLFACGGYVPVRVEVYDNVTACSRTPGPQFEEAADPVTQGELRVLAQVLERAIGRARLRPAEVPFYPGFSQAFHRYLHDALTGSGVVDGPALAGRLTACSGWTPAGPAPPDPLCP